jgi:protein-S-isoprenylcysteine O-methyltransferase Ste14
MSGAAARPFIAYGHFLFRTRNWFFPLVLVPIFLLTQPVPDPRMHVLGVLVSIAGLAFRALVIGLAYIKRGGIGKRIAAPVLVTEGMFAHVRNPLYLGNLLIAAGLLIVHNDPWSYLLGGGFVLLSYASIVAAEEEFLRGRFGAQYEAYCARVPRWLPDLRHFRRTLAGMRFDGRRVLAKDYGTAAAWAISVSLLFMDEVRAGVTANVLPASFALFLVLLGALGIRMLKRSGGLHTG